MNHTSRPNWSNARQYKTLALGNIHNHSPGKCFRIKPLATAVLAAFISNAHALPTNGAISAGSGSIAQNGSAMTVNQSSQNLAVNWQSFNIGANERVNFAQPNASAIALNRVLGSDPSQILGQLNANGQVWILNPNGLLFGSSAQVNVGGLVASTLDISDADFLAGKRSFSGSGGAVTNQGAINANYVALLGGQVSNEGVITAQLGTIALAAGNQITLDFNGDQLLNVQVNQGALDALAQNKQLIRADGGTVLMTAQAADVLTAAVVNNTGVIEARTIENHNGVIKLLGDMQNGTVNVAGTLDASAPNSGDGGFVETSAAHVKVADDALVTSLAANGKAGTWLIDPHDYNIAASGGDITGTALSNNLNNGSITIQSGNGAGGGGAGGVAGDVNVDDAISWSANTTLTLQAYHYININAGITATGASAGLILSASGTTAGCGNCLAQTSNDYASPDNINFFPVVRPGPSPSVTLSGANATLSINGASYTLIHDLNSLQQTIQNDLTGNYALAVDIDATPTATWNPDGSGGYKGFIPIGPRSSSTSDFTGTLNGLGHTITGIYINTSTVLPPGSSLTDETGTGLFGGISSGSVLNLGLVGGSIIGGSTVGSIAGYAGKALGGNSYDSATLHNVFSTAQVTGLVVPNEPAGQNVGGLLGILVDGTVSDSYATGNVTSAQYIAGGLIGEISGGSALIYNSFASGNVTAGTSANGGSGGDYAGGLIGIASGDVHVQSSYATGNVTALAVTSGNGWGLNAGGLIGSTGLLGGPVTSVKLTMLDSYATGAVVADDYAGGLFGQVGFATAAQASGSLLRVYAAGHVTANGAGAHAGGVAGNVVGYSNQFAGVYWDTQTSGQATSPVGTLGGASGGTGLTTAQMMDPTSYDANWAINVWTDATSIGVPWVQYSGHTYPLLTSMMTPLTITGGSGTKVYDGQSWSGLVPGSSYQIMGGYSGISWQDELVSPYSTPLSAATSTAPSGLHASTTGTAVGTYTLDIWSDQFGYYLSPTAINLPQVTINPAPIVVAPTTISLGVGADNQSKTYGSPDPALTWSIASGSLAPGDSLSGSLVRDPGENVGGYAIRQGSLSAGANYTVTFSNGVLTIVPAPLTVRAGNAVKTYDGLAYSGGNGVVYSGLVNGDGAGVLGGALVYGGSAQGAVNAGSYAITPSGLTSTNYAINYVSGALTVNPAPLTIAANAADKTYDGLAYSGGNGVVYSGFVNNETTAALGGALVYGGSAQGAINAGNYLITPRSLSGLND